MRDAKNDEYLFLGLLLIPTIWFAFLIAPYMDQGLIHALSYLSEALNHPGTTSRKRTHKIDKF